MATCTYCGASAGIFKSTCYRCLRLPEHERVRLPEPTTDSLPTSSSRAATPFPGSDSDTTIDLVKRAVTRNALLYLAILSALAIWHYLQHGHLRPMPAPPDGDSSYWAVVLVIGPFFVGLFGLVVGRVLTWDEDGDLTVSRSANPKQFWNHVIFWFTMGAAFLLIIIWRSCAGR